MADLSKIKLNGVEYNLKDTEAREQTFIITISSSVNANYEYDSNVEYSDFLAAFQAGKRCLLFQQNQNNHEEFLFKGEAVDANSSQGEFVEVDSFSPGTKNHENISVKLYFWKYKAATNSLVNGVPDLTASPVTSSLYSSYLYLTNSLPRTRGQADQVPAATGTSGVLKWVNLPTVEDMANVTAMLTSYGLNTTTTLSAAAAGTAELDFAVVQDV